MTYAHHLLKLATLDLDPALHQALKVLHNTPNRYYHTWDHAVSVLSWVQWVEDRDLLEGVRELYHEMKLAALFHDSVYDVSASAGDNEEQSAEMLKTYFPRAEEAYNLIQLTASHGIFTRESKLPQAAKVFLDCDVAYMFAEPHYTVFSWLDSLVVEEYCHVYPREQVVAGRRQFLMNMRKKGVFLSDTFYGRFEEIAQENLTRLIECYE